MLSNVALAGTVVHDGVSPAAAVAIAGEDVWVSIAVGPKVVLHFHTDGTFVASVPLAAASLALTALEGTAYGITNSGEVIALDAATNVESKLASLPMGGIVNATIAASGSDLWADTTELIHVDLATKQVTDSTPAVIYSLAADPHEPGRAWAAPFETDPQLVPGPGNGEVVRLSLHGVGHDGSLHFDTISMQGVNRLVIAPDGTVYGESAYTTTVYRISLS
ncbi:MAG TPA: hypothetical protein VGM78_08455 [Ilumatobacteraceae bacterium]